MPSRDPATIGELRHVITIESFVIEQNSSGEDVKTYSFYAKRNARIRTLRGRELIAAQADFAAADVEIVCRFVRGLTEKMRIRHGDTYYDIVNVDDVDRLHVWHILSCQTGLADER